MPLLSSILAAVLILIPIVSFGGIFSPTPYQKIQSCTFFQTLKMSKKCAGGYSSIKITPNKYLVKSLGNQFTSEERVTYIAIKRCAEIAIHKNYKYIALGAIESEVKQRVSGTKGNVSTIEYPIASVMCVLKSDNNAESLLAREVFEAQKIK